MTTTIKNLKLMPYAQAHVILHDDGDKTLVSYQTQVARITADGYLEIGGLYSMTTRKHIRAFVREFIPYELSFDLIKFLAHNFVMYDINAHIVIDSRTGEIIDF